jgi:hypothetical protein
MVSSDIWMGSGATVSMIPEQDINLGTFASIAGASGNQRVITLNSTFTTNFSLVANLYRGCYLNIYKDSDDSFTDRVLIQGNAANTLTVNDSLVSAITDTATDYYGKIEGYGAPVPAPKISSNPALLSDTWLGLVSSVTIPQTNVTTEQMNLVAGGTRNFIYQYKGIEETSGGSLDMLANSFWPLYYALGRSGITVAAGGQTRLNGAGNDATPTNQFTLAGSPTGTDFIYNPAEDIIYRAEGTKICPPLDPTQSLADYYRINGDDVENDFITYLFTEENGHTLPSFALEYTLKKADQNATVGVDSAKENVYTKIYPGTVISSLTMNADVAGPVNMNLSLAHKNTFVAPTNYQTLNGATDVKNFANYRGRLGQTETLADDSDADTEPLMRPFFFADGTISLFGQDYIRLASFNLTIDNQLQAQRYIGRYDKNSQTQLTGQRTYTLSFTGHVTDAAVFTELQNQLATALSSATSEIVLRFTKENGEELQMKFRDYMVTSAEFPVGNDRGPVVVNWTIQPLTMQECAHTTYWAIQG